MGDLVAQKYPFHTSNIEYKSCSTTWVDPKTVLNPTPTPKIAHLGLQKVKKTPKLSQNQKANLKELQKIKIVQLHDQTPK